MKVGTHSGVRHQDGRDFFYLLFKMQRITDFLKKNDVESDALKKYRQRLTNLHKEATLAYKSHGHEISRSTLDDFLKMRNLVVIGRKEEKVARLLRDANTFKEQFDSDKAGHRKKRVPFSDEEKEAIKVGIKVFGHGKWTQIKDYSPEALRNRTGVQIKDCARNLFKSGMLK